MFAATSFQGLNKILSGNGHGTQPCDLDTGREVRQVRSLCDGASRQKDYSENRRNGIASTCDIKDLSGLRRQE